MIKLMTLFRDIDNWLLNYIIYDPLNSMALCRYLLSLVAWVLFIGLSNKFKTSNSLFVHNLVLLTPKPCSIDPEFFEKYIF